MGGWLCVCVEQWIRLKTFIHFSGYKVIYFCSKSPLISPDRSEPFAIKSAFRFPEGDSIKAFNSQLFLNAARFDLLDRYGGEAYASFHSVKRFDNAPLYRVSLALNTN